MSAPHEFDQKRYQSFDIGNDGQKVVRDFKIVYGELTMPHGTNFTEIPAVHGTMRSEAQVVPIPPTAEVSWHDSDGKRYVVSVPIRASIKDMSTFYGFKFYFVDDHLDVYLVSKKVPKTSKFLELTEEKIFSK